MELINIRESLLKIDRDTDCKYDLTTLYESCNLSEENKKQLVKMIANYDSPEALGSFMSKSSGLPCMSENVSDDLSEEEIEALQNSVELEEGAFADTMKVLKAAGKSIKNDTSIGRAATNIARGIKKDAQTLYKMSGADKVVKATKDAIKDTDIYKNFKGDEGAYKASESIKRQKDKMKTPDNLSKYIKRMKDKYPMFDYSSSNSRISKEIQKVCKEKGWDFEQVLNKAGLTMKESLKESIDSNALENEIRTEVANIIDDVDMPVVEFSTEDGFIKIEVRAELGYDMLMDVANKLDPIVEKYDERAYFEPVTAGILVAYVDENGYVNELDQDAADMWIDKFANCKNMHEIRIVHSSFRDADLSMATVDAVWDKLHDIIDKIRENEKDEYLFDDLDTTLEELFEQALAESVVPLNESNDEWYVGDSESGHMYPAQDSSIKESLYLFPELNAEDLEAVKTYGLNYLGRNKGAKGDEDNYVVAGDMSSLQRFADKYLGYELHPDYLYDDADDFAGEIIKEEVELTNCPNCGGERFNDNTGLCVDCGYDEKSYGDLDESGYDFNKYRNEEGKLCADKWYAGQYPDDKEGAKELSGILMDDALEDRSIIDDCSDTVKERVNKQLDRYAGRLVNESAIAATAMALGTAAATGFGSALGDKVGSKLLGEDSSNFEYVESKSVEDTDGFMTDYTMYKDVTNDRYVFVFGDRDIYSPEDGDFDWECETEEEAKEWFNSYNGFEDFELEESTKEPIVERGLTRAERHNRSMDKIFDYKKSTDSKMMQFLRDNSDLSEEEIQKAYDDDKLGLKIKELGLHDDFWSKNEGYELLNGNKVEVYSDYYVAKDRAKSLGLTEAEYGDTYSGDYAYSYWNESGDRNDDEQVIAYYRFKNGAPRPLTVEEREDVLNKHELGSFDNKAMEESVDLKESEEEEPYSKEMVEQDLKSITHNFTDKEGELKCGFEEEKNYGVEILKKHYDVVEVSGDDRRDGTWYHISFSNPKSK